MVFYFVFIRVFYQIVCLLLIWFVRYYSPCVHVKGLMFLPVNISLDICELMTKRLSSSIACSLDGYLMCTLHCIWYLECVYDMQVIIITIINLNLNYGGSYFLTRITNIRSTRKNTLVTMQKSMITVLDTCCIS